MNNGIKITKCSPQQLDYVWQNLRPADRAELEISGRTDCNYRGLLKDCTELECGEVDGVPVACRGYTVENGTIYMGFFATPESERWWLSITRMAKAYIEIVKSRYPGLPIVVACDARHSHSLKWLGVLGFEWDGTWLNLPGGRLIGLKHQP